LLLADLDFLTALAGFFVDPSNDLELCFLVVNTLTEDVLLTLLARLSLMCDLRNPVPRLVFCFFGSGMFNMLLFYLLLATL